MSADELIYSRVSTDPAITGLVQNIFIGRVTNNAAFPILQFQQIGGNPVVTMDKGRNDLRNPSYQIDVYADTRANANQIMDAVLASIANQPFPTGFYAVPQDEPFTVYEEDVNDNRLTARVSIWYNGG